MIEIKVNFKHIKFELIIGKGVNANEEEMQLFGPKREAEEVDLHVDTESNTVNLPSGVHDVDTSTDDELVKCFEVVSGVLGDFPLYNDALLDAIARDYYNGAFDSSALLALRKEQLDQEKEVKIDVPACPDQSPESAVDEDFKVAGFDSIELSSDTEKVVDLMNAFDANSEFNQNISSTKARFLSEIDEDGLADMTPPIEYDGSNMPCGTEIPNVSDEEYYGAENANRGKANM